MTRRHGKTGTGLVALVAAVFVGVSLAGALSAAERTVMRFDRISVAEGLSQSSVMAIAQDSEGFMWLATENGLDRFDGHDFTNYRQERGNPDALASDFARDIDVAPDGSLWVATDGGGLSHWNPSTNTFTTYRHDMNVPASIATDSIRTVMVDVSGYVWIGTRGAGLDRLDPATGEFQHFLHDPENADSLSNDDVYAIAEGHDGAIWIGTRDGINRLDPHSGSVERVADDASRDSRIRSLFVDSTGMLWVGTNSFGLCRLDPGTFAVKHFLNDPQDTSSIASNRVDAIFEDSGGRLWAGTDQGLSLRLGDDQGFANFRNDPTDPTSLSGDSIFAITEDSGGVLWIGTRTGGISKWNPRSWSFGHVRPDVTESGGFGSTNVTSFAQADDQHVWVGTFGGGVGFIDADNRFVGEIRQDSGGLSDDRVMTLLADSSGAVWVGTMTGGLNRVAPESMQTRVFRHDPEDPTSLAADGVMSLLEDAEGRIWVGTFGGGVSRLNEDGVTFTNFGHSSDEAGSLTASRATSLAESSTGVVFAGTDGGGLNYLQTDDGAWDSIQHDRDDPLSLKSNTIYSLHVDARDRLWVGTRAGLDLVVRDAGRDSGYRVANMPDNVGLPRSAIFGIQPDEDGVLWLSTGNGLFSFDPATGVVQDYHLNQGLQGEEFNFGASFRSSDGTLYFGGSNGFNAFRPQELDFNLSPPDVALTSLSILNEPQPLPSATELEQGISLGFDDYVVSFGFAALDFAAPEENSFSYMLEGFDEKWNRLDGDRRITYTNLDGGHYILRVRAANSDGTWNERGISIPVNVAYPPWKTWWAYLLYALTLGLIIIALWQRQQARLRREYEYSRRLEAEVRERTAQLKNRNKDLKHANEKLVEASTTDALTGLRNRRYLFEQARKDVDLVMRHYRNRDEHSQEYDNSDLTFLMVDLDNFKPVNDSCGHESGDELLLQVRDVLLDACRSTDDVVRWGGDEFLIVARETDRHYAAILADRIRANLAQRVFPVGNGQVARITTSIGYASYPFLKDQPELLTWEEVLGVADAAMYEAKRKRNAWVGIECLQWDKNGSELYRAIKSNPGQLAEEGVIRAVESVEDAAEHLA